MVTHTYVVLPPLIDNWFQVYFTPLPGFFSPFPHGLVQRAADQKAALNEYSDNPFIQMGAEAYQQFKPLWAPDLINENAHGTSETADYLKNQARLNQQSATENLVGNRIPGADIGSTIE